MNESKVDKVAFMNSFGGKKVFLPIEMESIAQLDQLLKEMQITYDNVSPTANMASFICYSHRCKIDTDFICGRSGFLLDEVDQLIIESKEIGIYDELCEEFLRK